MKPLKNGLLLITGILIGYSASVSIATVYAQGMPFGSMDTDRNGMISEQEFQQAKSNRMASKAAQGGQIRGLKNAPTFASIDVNNDGQLTSDELQAMQQTRRNGMMQQGKGQGIGQGKNQGGSAMGRPPMPVFADFDANHDQSLSEQEYYDARNARIANRAKEGRKMRGLENIASFTDIDSNADGKITEDEFLSFRQAHMKKGHP